MTPCARIVAGLFGSLFLVALLSVPVTVTTSRQSREPGSNVVVRTTFPRRATMFLPAYLAARGRGGGNGEVRARTNQWAATAAVILVLGIFDYAAFCRLLLRPGGKREEDGLSGKYRPEI